MALPGTAQLTTSIDLRHSSVCTDSPTGSDLFPYTNDPVQFIQNTGIERNGGISALYLQTTTFTTATCPSAVIAKDGTLIQVDSNNNVLLNNTVIGNVGTLAVYARGYLPQYVDACWTADSTILGLKQSGFTLTIDEYDPFASPATVKNTRNVTWASFGISTSQIISVSFVRYVDMHYADNQEFIVWRGLLNGTTTFLQESGTTLATISSYAANFAFRFQAGTTNYLWGPQGFAASVASAAYWYTGTIAGGGSSLPVGQYVIIDRFPGTPYSRALLTCPWHIATLLSATLVVGGAFLGYLSSSGTLSTSPTYISFSIATTTTTFTVTPGTTIMGPGQSEIIATLTPPGQCALYSVTSWDCQATLTWNTFVNSDLPVGLYGKLTGLPGNVNCYAQWRSCSIGSIPSYLSVAINRNGTDGTDECLGVPITNIGEYDPYFVPHVEDDNLGHSRVIYRYAGNLFWVDIRSRSSLTTSSLFKISDNLYGINTISPVNVINLTSKSLNVGTNDYNGRCLLYGSFGVATKIACVIQASNSNSVDVGDKITTTQPQSIASMTALSNSVVCVGIALPFFCDRTPPGFGINIYYQDVYWNTQVLQKKSTPPILYPNPDFSGVSYVPDTRIPFGMGYTFSERIMRTEIETILLGVGVTGFADIVYDYAGYEIGNDLPGQFSSFVLFGQTYLFDGNNIWLTSFSGSLYSGKGNSPICPATGMTFIAAAPTEAYFLSSFDNSLFVFNGGRSLTKVKRLNSEDTIANGVFNVRDNTLLLNGTNHWIWMRDGIVTVNAKLATQTSTSLFDTQQGITIANTTSKWLYSYASLGGTSTVVPLTWQSAYHSLKGNELSEAVNWVVTLYSPDGRISAPVTLTCHSFDQDGYHKQTASMTINPGDWDNLGFVRTRIQPQKRKALASSVQVDTTSHLVITDVAIQYGDVGQAAIAAARSK